MPVEGSVLIVVERKRRKQRRRRIDEDGGLTMSLTTPESVQKLQTALPKLPEEKLDFLGYSFGRCYSPKTVGPIWARFFRRNGFCIHAEVLHAPDHNPELGSSAMQMLCGEPQGAGHAAVSVIRRPSGARHA